MSGFINYASPTANLHGCEPCPKCKGKFRAPFHRGGKLVVECDDCGHKEAGVASDDISFDARGNGGR